MNRIIYFFLSLFFFVPLFQLLESGILSFDLSNLVLPCIYSLILSLCLFFPKAREYALIGALTLLSLMIVFYVSGIINWAEVIGSLGFGIFILTVSTYLPEILRKGYIERL